MNYKRRLREMHEELAAMETYLLQKDNPATKGLIRDIRVAKDYLRYTEESGQAIPLTQEEQAD